MKITTKVRGGRLVLYISHGAGASRPRSLGVPLESRYLLPSGVISKAAPRYEKLREIVNKHVTILEDIQVDLVCDYGPKITLDMILEKYDQWKDSKAPVSRSEYLMDYWDDYSEYRWIKLKKKKSSFKKVEDTENELRCLDREKRLRLDDVGIKMTQAFIDMLIEGRGHKGSPNGNNTIKKKLGEFKRFLDYTNQKGLHNNVDFKAADVDGYEPEMPSYDESELIALYNLDIKAIPGFREKHDIARDLYVVCGYTGVSFGDIGYICRKNISSISINGKNIFILRYRRNKTTVTGEIPLNKMVISILNKWNWQLPKTANQTANKAIKEVARAAGIDGEHTYVKWIGKERIEETMPRWKAMKFHSSRSSFTTNNLVDGVNISVVARMNGQKNTTTTQKYFRPGTSRQAMSYVEKRWDDF